MAAKRKERAISIPEFDHDTLIIGAGQAGLAMSRLLSETKHDHLVLEGGARIGGGWRNRWDSFTLVTPNWATQLPGFEYDGEEPDGFMHRDEVVSHLERYASSFEPPLRTEQRVRSVERDASGEGFRVTTEDAGFRARRAVVAVGSFQQPAIPDFAGDLPASVEQLHSSDYRNPEQLPEGAVLVVGSGQSGCQIGQELRASGREVYLSVGSAGRLPRRYRGKDAFVWAEALGLLDQTVDQLESPEQRFAANPQISGKDGGQDINLHDFARQGIGLVGHLEGFDGRRARLATDLHDQLKAADEFASGFRAGVDQLIDDTRIDVEPEAVEEPDDGFEIDPPAQLDLEGAGIRTVLWATGFGWDFDWVEPARLDEFGYPIQRQGVSDEPGLYFLGLHFLHSRKSGLLLGVGEDALNIADHIHVADGSPSLLDGVFGEPETT